ncbi:hypothetical protein L596_014304 [Steinernema carpocapsae]|uniref:Uncharacterized protein n=1 Tax=Steinernema carpocapsae TaxID=34508 RepID=A0A4U5NCC2_STECR|nr:hypothetical protein L596_014304 [Steinernema carpocapsae]
MYKNISVPFVNCMLPTVPNGTKLRKTTKTSDSSFQKLSKSAREPKRAFIHSASCFPPCVVPGNRRGRFPFRLFLNRAII